MFASKAKILFVDDEPSILKGFQLNLGRKYEVFVAESGAEGLRILEEDGPFQIIVSDFSMPVMNGADFLERLESKIKKLLLCC